MSEADPARGLTRCMSPRETWGGHRGEPSEQVTHGTLFPADVGRSTGGVAGPGQAWDAVPGSSMVKRAPGPSERFAASMRPP